MLGFARAKDYHGPLQTEIEASGKGTDTKAKRSVPNPA